MPCILRSGGYPRACVTYCVTQPETDETTEAAALHERDGTRDARSRTTYRIEDDETVTEAVVRAVSSETRSSRFELPPLYSVIDPEALDDLFASPIGNVRRTTGTVAFEYCGRQVRVQANDTVQIGNSRDGRDQL